MANLGHRLTLAGVAVLALVTAAGCSASSGGSSASSSPFSVARPASDPLYPQAKQDVFQKTLNKALATQIGTPGAMVAIWTPGSGKWVGTAGTSDPATKTPVDPAAYFRIGSQTKPFTVTLLLQLVDEGKLSLGDTIEKWFPSLPDAKTITVKQLTDMTSGIKSYTTNPEFLKQWNANPVTIELDPDQLISWGTSLPRAFPPGQGMLYSDTNTVMVGRIVEMESGNSFSKQLEQKIVAPMALNDTSFPTPLSNNLIPDPYPQGFTTQTSTKPVNATNWNPSIASFAGANISTLENMQVWVHELGTGATLKPATWEQRRNIPLGPGNKGYGIGMFSLGGWLGHNGSIPGYTSVGLYNPANNTVIVVAAFSDICEPKFCVDSPAMMIWEDFAKLPELAATTPSASSSAR